MLLQEVSVKIKYLKNGAFGVILIHLIHTCKCNHFLHSIDLLKTKYTLNKYISVVKTVCVC